MRNVNWNNSGSVESTPVINIPSAPLPPPLSPSSLPVRSHTPSVATGLRRPSKFGRLKKWAAGPGMITAKASIVVLLVVIVLLAIVVIHYSPCNLVKVFSSEKMYGKPQDYHAGCTPHYAFRGSHDYNLVDYKPPHLINMYPSRHNFVHDI